MGAISDDLKQMGYERTEKESPFDDDGILWSNGVELVCDETAIVIDGTYRSDDGGDADSGDRDYFRYPNSERVRMVGGFFRPYLRADGLYGDSDES